MPQYGPGLDQVFEQNRKSLSNASVFEIGLKIIDILEAIHESGYVYNDLKLQNIMLNYNTSTPI